MKQLADIKNRATGSIIKRSFPHDRYFFLLALCIFLFCRILDAGAAQAPRPNPPEYGLSVSFDMAASKVMGTAVINVAAEQELVVDIEHLQVLEISVDGQKLESNDGHELRLHPLREVVIRYERTFGKDDASVIDDRGIILTSLWYPIVEGFCRYRLTAVLPAGYEAISEAEQIHVRRSGAHAEFRFDFPHPLREGEGISLVASSRFVVVQDRYKSVRLYAYLLPDEAHLAGKYLAAAKKHIEDYEKRLTPFPYRRFSIVESFLPSAYSLPTMVLMSREEILIPDIERTALGHEIMHQWFGNSVFSDYAAGNWNEGFTIYFADHAAQEQKGRAWQCRRRILSGFQSTVNEKNDFPLVQFTERADDASRMIGYGKSAMVVHMLRKLSGDKLFSLSVKDFIRQNTFKVSTWYDIRIAFERRLKRDLGAFFSQWVQRPGRPELEILDMETARRGSAYHVSFAVRQKTAPYELVLPVHIYYQGGVLKRVITVQDDLQHFSFQVSGKPREVVIDEEYDILRALLPAENPPTFERIVTDGKIVVVPPPARMGRYREVVETLQAANASLALQGVRGGYEKKQFRGGPRKDEFRRRGSRSIFSQATAPLSDADLNSSAIVVLGTDNPLIERLFAERLPSSSSFRVEIRRNPLNPAKVVAIMSIPGRLNTQAPIRELFRFPFYTHYETDREGSLVKRLEISERGIRIGFHENRAHAPGSDAATPQRLTNTE